MTDFELMGAALEEARKAAALGEVPVGAVVAKDGEIISAAHNTRETEKNALHHAELLAIDAACKKLGGWRLWQCGFDKFPLNNIAQSGEKIKWSPVIFSRSSHFFHRFRGSRAASSGALRPAWPAVKRKIPAKAAVPHRPAVPSR